MSFIVSAIHNGFWIGLIIRRYAGAFEWANASTVKFTDWNVNEPENDLTTNERCVLMNSNVSSTVPVPSYPM